MENAATTTNTKKALYWAATGLSGLGLAAAGAADLVQAPKMVEGLAHLGYPAYFASILGAWKLAGVAALLAPGLPRLKEWAYAGFFFALTGAAISHAASGDDVGKVMAPLVLLGVVLTSRATRSAREAVVAGKAARPYAAQSA